MTRDNILRTLAVLLIAGSGAAAAQMTQEQSQTSGRQYQTQTNGSTYQSQYQVNGSTGAGQGQGIGSSQAQADYGASSSLRGASAYPQGSLQTQQQSLGTWPSQTSTTQPPQTNATSGSARPM